MGDTDITRLLNQAAAGDREAGDEAWGAVYEEVRRIAHRELARRGGATLSTTGLIHEAYVKLAAPDARDVQDRSHFYALACRAMRQVLVDRARRRNAGKRGGGEAAVTLHAEAVPAPEVRDQKLLDLDEALARLATVNPRLVQVVECRFFGGLSFPETAETLGISLRTAERDWGRARAHLYRMLQTDG